MEHKVNEIFDFFGTKIKCVDSKNRHCSDCFLFDFAYCYMYTSILDIVIRKIVQIRMMYILNYSIKMNNMKLFNLQEYIANPSRKIVTRAGDPVRIICTDAKMAHPIIALTKYEDGEIIRVFKQDGTWINGSGIRDYDLFFAPVKKEGWTNIYIDINGQYSNGSIYNTKEEASKAAGFGFIATTKIEWEE